MFSSPFFRTGFAPTEKLSDVLVTYIKNLGGQTEEEYSCAQCNAVSVKRKRMASILYAKMGLFLLKAIIVRG